MMQPGLATSSVPPAHLGADTRPPLRVGGATMEWNSAVEFVSRYTLNETKTWSYPAYDGFPGHDGPELGKSDLLAATLLNVERKSIVAYYGLESMLSLINDRLSHPALSPGKLLCDGNGTAEPDTLDAIARLYGALDEIRPPQVTLVRLSKVLHRKRPGLLPLYDKHIRRCYQFIGDAPVPPIPKRSYTEFMQTWLPALVHDLHSQFDSWCELAALAPIDGPAVTPLRALDMVGWKSGSRRN